MLKYTITIYMQKLVAPPFVVMKSVNTSKTAWYIVHYMEIQYACQ